MISLERFISKSFSKTFIFLVLASFFLEMSFGLYELNVDRKQERSLLLQNLASIIRDPLNQGSYVEAYDRLIRYVGTNGIQCLTLTIDSQVFGRCAEKTKANDIPFRSEDKLNDISGKISVWVDDSDIWKKHARSAVARLAYYLLVLFILTLVLKRKIFAIDSELNLVQKKFHEAESENVGFKIKEIGDLSRTLQILAQEQKHAESNKVLTQIARQVAHDIRSPLSAINIISGKISGLNPEYASILSSSSIQLNEIANDLLSQTKNAKKYADTNHDSTDIPTSPIEKISIAEMAEFIKEIIAQKSLEERSKKIKFSFYNNTTSEIFFNANRKNTKRIVSNLLNNSIEAIDGSGFISVEFTIDELYLRIDIRDSGVGIPKEVLNEIGKKPITFGKANGNGLGLHHAFSEIQGWGGMVSIFSNNGSGTSISIHLKIS